MQTLAQGLVFIYSVCCCYEEMRFSMCLGAYGRVSLALPQCAKKASVNPFEHANRFVNSKPLLFALPLRHGEGLGHMLI